MTRVRWNRQEIVITTLTFVVVKGKYFKMFWLVFRPHVNLGSKKVDRYGNVVHGLGIVPNHSLLNGPVTDK